MKHVDVSKIKQMILDGLSSVDIALILDVSRCTIRNRVQEELNSVWFKRMIKNGKNNQQVWVKGKDHYRYLLEGAKCKY